MAPHRQPFSYMLIASSHLGCLNASFLESQLLTGNHSYTSKRQPFHDLADQLKIATASYHRRAERTGIVNDILKKCISRQAYILYIRNLYPIYAGLEKPFEPAVAQLEILMPFLDNVIRRSTPLSQDLCNLTGRKDWQNLPLLQSSLAYSNHIDYLRQHDPISLLGHIYVRYLGDMNGGQVLHRLLSETLELPHEALNFYQYPAIHEIVSFRQGYRSLFNSVKLNAPQRRKVIETAIKAFEFNINLSEDIKAIVTQDE